MQDDRDMTTRPSQKKDEHAPMEKSGTAKQPRHTKDSTPSPASDDPSE